MKSICTLCFFVFLSNLTHSQSDEDAFFIKEIYSESLLNGQAYDWLHHLSENIGGRLAGSENAENAVIYTESILQSFNIDTVRLQKCEVPVWERGIVELVAVVNSSSKGTFILNSTSLGNSTGSGPQGIFGEVIEVQSLDELKALSPSEVSKKIVFFNRPMDPTQINSFRAYGGAVDQRGSGPALAAKKGATGAIVRSMTNQLDDVPHTGVTVFASGDKHIPSMAITTNDAELLSNLMDKEPVSIYMENDCFNGENKTSYNVIGEIKGSEHPDEIILVGGHLDSWDLGGGAHDDGAGCVHSMQVLSTLRALNYTPKRTIRCVLFMNEENGLGGAKAYAKASNEKREYHMAAIESDAGGFSPRGFGVGGSTLVFEEKFPNIRDWRNLLGSYGLELSPGGGGADINPLKSQGGLLFGLRPDSNRYFDFHHTANDRIAAVNQRELHLGAAAMTSLVYLLDKYGIESQ